MNKSDNYRYFTHLKMGERGIFSEEGQGAALWGMSDEEAAVWSQGLAL